MILSKIYHFLGSVYFAIILISTVAIFVIAGTLIESSTQSHRYAALLTYNNPVFIGLLWGFFINILLSALRRWPFKVRHIPFLITHFGLLMILGGILIKVYFGQQGTMGLMEGAGTHKISENNTHVVLVEKRGEIPYSLSLDQIKNNRHSFPSKLSLQLMEYTPNSTERLASWIKGKQAHIYGLPPMSVHDTSEIAELDEIPLSGKASLHYPQSPTYEIYCLHSDKINQTLNKLYRQGAFLKVSERNSGNTLATVSLDNALDQTISLNDTKGFYDKAKAELNLTFSEIDGFKEDALIKFQITNKHNNDFQEIGIPLSGDGALLNANKSTPYLGSTPITIDLVRPPALILIEDQHNDTYLIAFDARGQVWSQAFGNSLLKNYLSYDEGYGGYAVQAELPFPDFICGREQREIALIDYLAMQIRQTISSKVQLSPPLNLFKNACLQANTDFVDTLMEFLRYWDNQHNWVLSSDLQLPENVRKSFEHINWQQHPKEACRLTLRFFDQIESEISKNDSLLEVLRKRHWPLVAACEELSRQHDKDIERKSALLTLLTQQIFSAAETFQKEEALPVGSEQSARLFSAYLRAYDIHLSTIMPTLSEFKMRELIQNRLKAAGFEKGKIPSAIIETPLIAILETAPRNKKMEDEVPAITLRAYENNQMQSITMGYDRFASGLKWPILDGQYLLRFQPRFLDIPYTVRLRQARQVNYPNTKQAFSYESDIIVTDQRTGESEETTISMNQVHETWDGYRFYLSNISSGDETAVKRVQIIVNHDPAKYWLTYPGAIILSLGIILLFWMRPYQKKKG